MTETGPETGVSRKLVYRGTAIGLPDGTLVVGRAPSCFLQLHDELLSRKHFQLLVAEQVQLEDLGSAGGTFVNNIRVHHRLRLRDGDQIRAGRSLLRYQELDDGVGGDDGDDDDTEERLEQELTFDPHGKTRRGLGGDVPPLPAETPSSPAPAPPAEQVPAPPRRGARRASGARAATLTLRYRSETRSLEGTALRLTEEEVFIGTKVVDSVGTICRVSFVEGEAVLLQVDGLVTQVVHRGTRGMGITFLDLNETTMQRIRQLLARVPASARS